MPSVSSHGGDHQKRAKSIGESAFSLPRVSAVFHPSTNEPGAEPGAKSTGSGPCRTRHELPLHRSPTRRASSNCECLDQKIAVLLSFYVLQANHLFASAK